MVRCNWIPVGLLALSWPCLAWNCWDEAATRYQINPNLLNAIAICESGLRTAVINQTHVMQTGTYDVGLMQVNSANLRRLGTFGITERNLYNACTNIQVGAWILADKIRRYGLSWEAVGAYNAACTELKGKACNAARSKYAWCVYRNLQTLSAASLPFQQTPLQALATRVLPIIASKVVQ